MGKGQKQKNKQIVIINQPQPPPPVTPQIPPVTSQIPPVTPQIPPVTPQKQEKVITKRWMVRRIITGLLCPIIAGLIIYYCTTHPPIPKTNNPLTFTGWQDWGGVQDIPHGDTVNLNGRVNMGGYFSDQLPPNLRGKTIILEILNAEASVLSRDRLIKITVNNGDWLVHPKNVPILIDGEYIHSDYKLVEFTLPDDFSGKLGFVFNHADLRDLRITMRLK